MNLNYTDDDNKFRKKVIDFIKNNLSQEAKKRVSNGGKYSKEEIIKWQKALFKAGMFAYNWPKVHGGCDWSPMQRYI